MILSLGYVCFNTALARKTPPTQFPTLRTSKILTTSEKHYHHNTCPFDSFSIICFAQAPPYHLCQPLDSNLVHIGFGAHDHTNPVKMSGFNGKKANGIKSTQARLISDWYSANHMIDSLVPGSAPEMNNFNSSLTNGA